MLELLIADLSNDVSLAEKSRQAGNHTAVEELYHRWITTRPEIDLMTISGAPSREVDLFKVGFAGLGRIRHVDINAQLQTTPRISDLLVGVNEVERLYQILGINMLPSFSIHRGSMCWPLEIAQDQARTAQIMGDSEKAVQIMEQQLMD